MFLKGPSRKPIPLSQNQSSITDLDAIRSTSSENIDLRNDKVAPPRLHPFIIAAAVPFVNGAHQVLDLNAIEERGLQGGAALTLGSMKLSADQRMLACTIDLEGNDRFVLAVFELGDGRHLDEPGAATILREDAM